MMPLETTKTAFTLKLDMLMRGTSFAIQPCDCTFTYRWDYEHNEGEAQLLGINGSLLAISLYPEGLKGMLAFFSDMQPTSYTIKGVPVVITKISLEIIPIKNIKRAAIVFNHDESVIQATDNFKL